MVEDGRADVGQDGVQQRLAQILLLGGGHWGRRGRGLRQDGGVSSPLAGPGPRPRPAGLPGFPTSSRPQAGQPGQARGPREPRTTRPQAQAPRRPHLTHGTGHGPRPLGLQAPARGQAAGSPGQQGCPRPQGQRRQSSALTTAMSFLSFSRAISHFCSVFRGHLREEDRAGPPGGGREPSAPRSLPSHGQSGLLRMERTGAWAPAQLPGARQPTLFPG